MDLCSTQADFILRAMQSRTQAKQAYEYYPADFVLNELQTMLSNEFFKHYSAGQQKILRV